MYYTTIYDIIKALNSIVVNSRFTADPAKNLDYNNYLLMLFHCLGLDLQYVLTERFQ